MKEILEWYGWGAVSAVAQILALITLIAGFVRYLVLKRQMPLVHLSWDFIGTATANGGEYHLVEFRNAGRGYAQFVSLQLVGAKTLPHQDFLAPNVLGSGESFKLLVTSEDLEKAWVRWIWRAEDHETRFHVRWNALIRTGELHERWDRESDEWIGRSYFEMMRDRLRPRYVGPGGAPRGKINGGQSTERRLAVLIGGDPEIRYNDVLAGTTSPRSLPYIP